MNEDLKKFLLRLLLLFGLLILCPVIPGLTGFLIFRNQFQTNYTASLIDKIARLNSINEPKIILEAGSNLAFGMNSPMLQEAMNMPVVNLGLHSGFGNAFNENEMKQNLNSGDIVIVCHLIFSDDNRINDTPLMWRTVEYHKDLWKILRWQDYLDMLKSWPDYVWNSWWAWIFDVQNYVPPYSRNAFNEYGDIIDRPEEARQTLDELLSARKVEIHSINDTCINRLNELNRYVAERGAVLLVAGYPIISGDFTPSGEDYDGFTQRLSSRLECEVISDYRDYFIPAKYFYDTIFHLDEQGAKIRTEQLIQDLKKWQEKRR